MEDNQELDSTPNFKTIWNDPELAAARKEFKKHWDEAMQRIEDNMTPEMVQSIREWRCEEDYTWRAVSRAFYVSYPEFCIEHKLDEGNQISGMMICEVAQKLLKQENSEGWN